MAKIVCISEDTYHEGLNNLGDIVEIQDDDVELTGIGYDVFKIINIPGIRAADIHKKHLNGRLYRACTKG